MGHTPTFVSRNMKHKYNARCQGGRSRKQNCTNYAPVVPNTTRPKPKREWERERVSVKPQRPTEQEEMRANHRHLCRDLTHTHRGTLVFALECATTTCAARSGPQWNEKQPAPHSRGVDAFNFLLITGRLRHTHTHMHGDLLG